MPEEHIGEPIKEKGFGRHVKDCPCGWCGVIRKKLTLAAEKEARGESVRHRLPVRKRRFIQAISDFNGKIYGDATKSAQLAGYEVDTAASKGAQLLREESIQKSILGAMERNGIGEDFLAQGIKDGLRADETRFFSDKGVVKDERQVKDWHSRAKFQELAHRLRGDYPKEDNLPQAALIISIGDKALPETGWADEVTALNATTIICQHCKAEHPAEYDCRQ